MGGCLKVLKELVVAALVAAVAALMRAHEVLGLLQHTLVMASMWYIQMGQVGAIVQEMNCAEPVKVLVHKQLADEMGVGFLDFDCQQSPLLCYAPSMMTAVLALSLGVSVVTGE